MITPKILDNTKRVKYIHHMSDIHIRLENTRHEEYRQVFSRLYKKINKNKEESIIVICGDILHSKLELSPECVQLTMEFFKELANITDLIIIAGNHDCCMTNLTKLDSLTPLIEEIKANNNIYYLKYSDAYTYGNITFGVSSVLDGNTKIIKAQDIYSDNIKIALYHGCIYGSKDFNNNVLLKSDNNMSTFTGYDYVLLGDIHKHQYLDKNKKFCYPSSLIQQNYGESLENHGYVLWNIENNTSTFINIKNDYGYVSCLMKNNILVNFDETKLPLKPRIKIKLDNTLLHEYEKIKKQLIEKYEIQEIIHYNISEININEISIINKIIETFENQNDPNPNQNDPNQDLNPNQDPNQNQNSNQTNELENKVKTLNRIINLNNINSQKILIKYYCENVLKLTDKNLIDNILKYHNELGTFNNTRQQNKWSIIKLEFENMFCYGKKNVINFNNMQGIIGLVASNGSGKSSVFDIILYCLYNKCSKGDRINIINNKKKNYYCKIELLISNTKYVIERSGEIKKNELKETVNFYKINNNKNQNLNGKDRIHTNNIITSYVGNYSDSIITSFCLQENDNFLDYSQNKKKDFLNKLLNLDIFNNWNKKAKEDLREITIKYKEKIGQIQYLNIEEYKTKKQEITQDNNTLVQELSNIETKLNDLITNKDTNLSLLYPIKYNIKNLNLEKNTNIKNNKNLQTKKNTIIKQIQDIENENIKINIEIQNINTKLTDEIINNNKLFLENKKNNINKLEQDIELLLRSLKTDINNNINNITKLLNDKQQIETENIEYMNLIKNLENKNISLKENIKQNTIINYKKIIANNDKFIKNKQININKLKNTIETLQNSIKQESYNTNPEAKTNKSKLIENNKNITKTINTKKNIIKNNTITNIPNDIIKEQQDKFDNYTELLNKKETIEKLLETINNDLTNKQNVIKKLECIKYDPNCQFCIKNNNIMNFLELEKEIIKTKQEYENIYKNLENINLEINLIKPIILKKHNTDTILNNNKILEKENQELNKEIELLEKEIIINKNQIKIYDNNIKEYNNIIKIQKANINIKNKIAKNKEELSILENSINTEYINYIKQIETEKEMTENLQKNYSELENIKLKYDNNLLILSNINKNIIEHENNKIIIQENKKINNEIKNKKAEIMKLKKEKNQEYDTFIKNQETYKILNDNIRTNQIKILEYNNNKNKIENDIINNTKNIEIIEDNIKKIENNIQLNKKLEKINISITNNKKLKKEIETKIKNNNDALNKIDNMINQYQENLRNTTELQQKQLMLQKYLEIVENNGLPSHILGIFIPEITRTANNILSMIANFTIDIELKEDKIFINKIKNNTKLPIESCCGFEKFITSFSIRLSLINFSNMNNTDFIILDESFTSFDSTNINSLDPIYDYLRSNYKYTILISHVQDLRSKCDDIINIQVNKIIDNDGLEINESLVIY